MSVTVPIYGFGGGGGIQLNFDIKAYSSETDLKAATPKENTIGVITTTPISSWVFSATEPTEPEAGMVWVTVGTSSDIAFNALRKNVIQLYPLSAKQFIDGAYEDKQAYSYINNEWTSWFVFDGYLYKSGDECVDVTGGWSQVSYPGYSNGSVSKSSSEIAFGCSSNNQAAVIQTNNKIKFKGFKTLTVNITRAQIEGNASSKMVVASAVNSAVQASLTISGTGKKSLNVEGVDGEYYVFIYALRPSGDFDVRFNEVTLT